jgi:transcriptional regulator with XRE-family HTH domain
MTKDYRDELVADLRANGAEGGSDQAGLTEEEASLVDVADLLWEAAHGAPPLDSDPVAAMLGLVPDPGCALDPNALRRVRKNAKLAASQLADRLTARGWDVQAKDVVRWENQSSTDVVPALIKAIAEETGTAMERLTRTEVASTETAQLTEVTESPAFQKLVERWVKLQGVPRALAVSALVSRMNATVHRGDRPDAEQLLQSLDALVTALESEDTR